MHYVVVDYPDDLEEFVRRVNIFAQYGWLPAGGMTATYLPEFEDEPPVVIFAQDMTHSALEPSMPIFKDEEDNEDEQQNLTLDEPDNETIH